MKRIAFVMCLGAFLGTGCKLGPMEAVHGDVSALVDDSLTREARFKGKPQPLVVKVEDRGVRAVDPRTNETEWFIPLPVVGHPVANDYMVAVPIRGNRIVAIDRPTGEIHWEQHLPGEAITGMGVSWRWLAVTTTGGEGEQANSLMVLGAGDGGIRWLHHSDESFGVPDVFGKAVVTSHRGQVVIVSAMFGRELARQDLPEAVRDQPRVVRRDGEVVMGSGNAWIDLGEFGRAVELSEVYANVYRPSDAVDPGHGEHERMRWVRTGPDQAVAMFRRAVFGVALGSDGRPERARWAHLGGKDDEYVAVDVARGRVHLVTETGAFVALSDADGRQLVHAPGHDETRGALLLDLAGAKISGVSGSISDLETVHELPGKLGALIADEDPRLLPAQKLAMDLLARGGGEDGERVLASVAGGEARPSGDRASRAVREHALAYLDSAGHDTSMLAARPEGGGAVEGLSLLAREAAAKGDTAAVPDLVAHLMHPSTSGAALEEVAGALCTLGTPRAREGLAGFVSRYHADRDVVLESRAMHRSVDCLSEHDDLAGRQLAAIVADPFTDPGLRAYIGQALPSGPTVFAQGPEEDDGAEAVSTPDL